MGYIFAADFGTSGAKAALFDETLVPVADAYRPYETERSSPTRAEQAPDDWWAVLCELVPDVLKAVGSAREEIVGIGFSSHYPSLLLTAADGSPLTPAFTWLDERGEGHAADVVAALQTLRPAPNPNPVRGFHPIPKLLWLREHNPDAIVRARAALQATGFLVARLTGRFSIDPSSASWYHNFDLSQLAWVPEAAHRLGLPAEIFPDVMRPDEIAGRVTPEAASATGLPPGAPVIVGTGDAVAAALGAGIERAGQVYVTTGTGACACAITRSPLVGGGLVCEAYVRPGLWVTEGNMKNFGSLLRWFDRELGIEERQRAASSGTTSFRILDEEIAAEPPGSGGVVCLPYFAGEQSPINDPRSRGVIFGLTQETRRSQILRAIIEATGFSLRHNLDAIAELGVGITELRATGGPVGSDVWAQILADATGRSVLRPATQETAPLGVARLVAQGLRLPAAAALASTRTGERFEPVPDRRHIYDHQYQTYREIYDRLEPVFRSSLRISAAGDGLVAD